MNKWIIGVIAGALAAPASAAITTLEGIASNGANDFTFTYQGTLGPDEGVSTGDRLIIFDFSGYIDGSVFSDSDDVSATAELISAMAIMTPGFDDDPNVANLVFTYTGPGFRVSGGPFPAFDFDGLGARSTFGGTRADAMFSRTTKNNPDGVPGGSGSKVFMLGSVTVPGAVPEPATWAMMIGGFGLIGAVSRRRRSMSVSYA